MRSRNVQLAVGSWHLDPTCSLLSPSYHFLLLHYLLVMADYFVQLSIYGTIRSLRMDKTCCLDHYVWYNSLFVCSPIPPFLYCIWFVVVSVFSLWLIYRLNTWRIWLLMWFNLNANLKYLRVILLLLLYLLRFIFFVVLLFLWYHGNPSKEGKLVFHV